MLRTRRKKLISEHGAMVEVLHSAGNSFSQCDKDLRFGRSAKVLTVSGRLWFQNPSSFRQYSLLHVDVKIYWQIFRMLYSYPMLDPIRHDLLLCFGLWHPYHYAYVAAWRANRSTFLGPAYFMLYPDHKLMDRPLLSQSATFFLWLRISYPSFKKS